MHREFVCAAASSSLPIQWRLHVYAMVAELSTLRSWRRSRVGWITASRARCPVGVIDRRNCFRACPTCAHRMLIPVCALTGVGLLVVSHSAKLDRVGVCTTSVIHVGDVMCA